MLAPYGKAYEGDVAMNNSTYTAIVAANNNRCAGWIANPDTGITLYVTTDSTGASGYSPIYPGGSLNIGGSVCAFYGKSASGTPNAHYVEFAG